MKVKFTLIDCDEGEVSFPVCVGMNVKFTRMCCDEGGVYQNVL